MSGLGSLLGMLAGFSLATGNGLSYLDSVGTCATCKVKGLDKNEAGESLCEACPYYETSLTMPDDMPKEDDNGQEDNPSDAQGITP